MKNQNKKISALLFSALMVLSIFAGVVAISGSAFGVALGSAEQLDSGVTYWQGQDIWLENGTAVATATTLQVRAVDSDNKIGSLVTEFQLDTANVAGAVTGKGTAKISTSALSGYYAITDGGEGGFVYISNATGQLASVKNAVGGAYTSPNATQIGAAKFEVTVQTLSVKLDDDSIDEDTTTTLDVTSNRGAFQIRVSSPELDEDDLTDIFAASGTTNDVNSASKTDEDDDGKDKRESILINTEAGQSIQVEFDGDFDDPGTYTFDIEVVDTDAEASATITVADVNPAYSFSQSVFTEETGDVAQVQIDLVDTTTAYLFVGGEAVNYLEGFKVTDGDDDGKVIVEINTYGIGRDVGAANTYIVAAGTDADRHSNIDGTAYGVDDSDDSLSLIVRYATASITTALDIDTVLSDPIEAADYDLRISSSATISTAGVVADEKAVATLSVTDRSTNGISVYRAAESDADDFDPLKDMSKATLVAEGGSLSLEDLLIIKVEMSGVFGHIVNKDLETVLGGVAADSGIAHGMNLTIEQTDAVSNQDAIVFALTTDDATAAKAQMYTDSDNNAYYVVVDSQDATTTNGSLAKGQDYKITAFIDEFNPYVKSSTEAANKLEATFQYVKEEAKFTGLNADDDLKVVPGAATVISGTATVAPQTEISVRVRNTGDNPFLKTKAVDVAADGTWSATFDLSDVAVGTEFKVVVLRSGAEISDSTDVEAVTTTATPTKEPKIVTRTIEIIRGTPTPQTIVEVQVEIQERTVVIEKVIENVRTVQVTPTPGQPGFGLAIAVVALLAAALFAVRRKD
jgi:pilus assembly protein FimV